MEIIVSLSINIPSPIFFAIVSTAVPLKPSKWVHTHWSGERAVLTLVHLNKEDEGMYTLRVNTKSGFDTYSAYVFVRGKGPKTFICSLFLLQKLDL